MAPTTCAPVNSTKTRTSEEATEQTIQIDSYQGKDRSFVLRFINSGTVDRQTRYGNRGYLRARDWFGRISAWHMNTAANEVVKMVEELLNAEFKLQ